VEISLLTWNLFHGRDAPPDRSLLTAGSRLLGRTERNATHVQVNRDLYPEFAALLRGASWDVALLQECPPRWTAPLARDCGAEAHRVLTSRNWFAPLTGWIAARNPDLIASWDGGCNAILARRAAGSVRARGSLLLRRWPERRAMAFTTLGCGLSVACLHLSQVETLARAELEAAARTAQRWSEGGPLVLGGDFNLRGRDDAFAQLADRTGIEGVTGPNEIDHLLTRGARVVRRRRWSPSERELSEDGLALRLSDHSPVELTIEMDG